MTDTTEAQDTMQDVVTILLNRMQEYPEEFVKDEAKIYDQEEGYSRFWKMADAIRRSMRVRANIARDIKNEEPDAEYNDPLWYLSKEERQALYDGMRNAHRHMLAIQVMTTLVAPEGPTKEERGKAITAAANAAANQLYNGNFNLQPMSNALLGASGLADNTVSAQQYYAQQQAQMQERQYRDALMAQQNVYGKLYGG